MSRWIAGLIIALCWAPLWAQDTLKFEAEDVSSPSDAWLNDVEPKDHWNLWSKDKDADKKWSGGRVLQSPVVKADRATPEEGAPVLHTVIPNVPNGTWVVEIKYGRGLAISLDNKEWKPLSVLGGRLGPFTVTDGKIEFWVDDRYVDPASPGSCYYDCITLIPAMPEKNGVMNGDFEAGTDLSRAGWTWWARNGEGSASFFEPGHSGKRCAKIVHTGDRDFAFTNGGRLNVSPGTVWVATAWVKCEDTDGLSLDVVALSQGKLLSWNIGSDGVSGTHDWKQLRAEAYIPDGCDQIYVRFTGSNRLTAWVDDVALEGGKPYVRPIKPLVKGWATERIQEKLDRGVVAMRISATKTYVSWRLLKSDPPNIAFDIYRTSGSGAPQKLNKAPITKTCDFTDDAMPPDTDSTYVIKPIVNGVAVDEVGASATVKATDPIRPYKSIKLQGDYRFQKVGIADLNGDGKYDFVIKQPADNIDPAADYWTRSPDTYKLEAYLNDGTFLWRKDLGWAIERGIWYSPYLVYDFDGDGKAEVAVKTGEGDPRDPDGRVTSGPEYLSILDGMTGEEKARVDWPSREPFGNYNYASRNQLAVGYLDGKTPCIIVLRGTYTLMRAIAYTWHDGKLTEVWNWSGQEERPPYRGQGAHFTHCADIDGDGRDEVILGSAVIDDNGQGLWSTGLGHPDKCYVTDVDPSHPGLEIFYALEVGHPKNGVCLVDAATGKILWGIDRRTYHVGMGMTADIDPTVPGQECWASEDPKGDPERNNYGGRPPRWIFSARGELLGEYEKVPGWDAVWWDADPVRELFSRGRVSKYGGGPITEGIEGSLVAVADVLGDWREEIITSVPGELRIYTTTVPASDRRVCLMQDPIYRSDVAHLAMGYAQTPMLSYYLGSTAAAQGITFDATKLRVGQPVKGTIRLAATSEPLTGTVTLSAPAAVRLEPATLNVSAPAGSVATAEFTATLVKHPNPFTDQQALVITSTFEGSGQKLTAQASLAVEDEPLKEGIIVQAEEFVAQEGGEVQIRTDKVGADGKCFSHWDKAGHALTWKVTVPTDGRYALAVRYCSSSAARRQVAVDSLPPVTMLFPATTGMSASANDWAHALVAGPDGKPWVLDLRAGEHTIRMTNVDGNPMNTDYLALLPR
jgi:rhamnogalacturonan endolyase